MWVNKRFGPSRALEPSRQGGGSDRPQTAFCGRRKGLGRLFSPLNLVWPAGTTVRGGRAMSFGHVDIEGSSAAAGRWPVTAKRGGRQEAYSRGGFCRQV